MSPVSQRDETVGEEGQAPAKAQWMVAAAPAAMTPGLYDFLRQRGRGHRPVHGLSERHLIMSDARGRKICGRAYQSSYVVEGFRLGSLCCGSNRL
jgi:hypothetical protein